MNWRRSVQAAPLFCRFGGESPAKERIQMKNMLLKHRSILYNKE